MKGGRKFAGLIISFGMLLIGMIIVHFLKMQMGVYEIYAKWTIVGLGIFTGGNAGITVSALIKGVAPKNESSGPL